VLGVILHLIGELLRISPENWINDNCGILIGFL